MLDDDFDQDDEEIAPESLQKKWEKEEFQEEFSGKDFISCPHCKQPIEKKSFSCLYCGGRIFVNSGLLGRFANAATPGTFSFVFVLIMIGLLAVLFLL